MNTLYKLRATAPIQADTNTGTRRCKVHGVVLTLGREPIYLEAPQLPKEIANDPYIEVEVVETVPPGAEILRLKAERVEEPEAADTAPDAGTNKLKAERVEEPQAAAALPETRLKAERVELPEAANTNARPGRRRQ